MKKNKGTGADCIHVELLKETDATYNDNFHKLIEKKDEQSIGTPASFVPSIRRATDVSVRTKDE